MAHAEGFWALARRHSLVPGPEGTETRSPLLLDLGSGGGLPGLVVAALWPEASIVLLDAHLRRTEFLNRAVIRLDLGNRVSVVQERAEVAGRDPTLRAMFDGVVVRSFGPPAVVAECAAPFLRPGGWLIVSEPPATAAPGGDVEPKEGLPEGQLTRWPAGSLSEVGLEPKEFVMEGFGYQVLVQRELCPDRFPRRNGVPTKSPLF